MSTSSNINSDYKTKAYDCQSKTSGCNSNCNSANQVLAYKDNQTSGKMLQNQSSKDMYKSSSSSQSGATSGYSSTKNSQTFKKEDKRTVTQNNINIGTMVGNLHLGPSFTLSSSRYQSKR
jgi:hypothetical protein